MSPRGASTNKACNYKDTQEFIILEIVFHHEEQDVGKAMAADSRGSKSRNASVGEPGDAHQTWPQTLISLWCLKSRIPAEIADHGGFPKMDIEVTNSVCLPSQFRRRQEALRPTVAHPPTQEGCSFSADGVTLAPPVNKQVVILVYRITCYYIG